jgi:flagellar biogenesis protein FliO
MANMTGRWIGIALVLAASSAGPPLVADEAVGKRANAPLAIEPNTPASHPARPAGDRSDPPRSPSSAPAGGRGLDERSLGARPLGAEPLPEQETRPLGPQPRSADDDRDASPAAGGDPGWSWALRTAMALGVVIAVVYVVRIALRRLHGVSGASSSRSSVVEVLTRCAVGPRTHVLLLRINKRIIVAGQTQAGLNTLAEVDDPDEVAGVLASVEASRPASISSGFNKLLRQFDRGHQMPSPDEGGADDAEHLVDRARSDVSSLIGRIRSHGQTRNREDDRP